MISNYNIMKLTSTQFILWSKIQGYIFRILGISSQNYYKKVVDIVCDGIITNLLYKWIFSFLFIAYLSTWYSWYYGSTIICKGSFGDDTVIPEDYLNLCLSYPYVINNDKRRYILFYRWLPACLLILSSLYYTPRLLAKYLCSNINEILSHKKDDGGDIVDSILNNLGSNNYILYGKYLMINIYCLVIEITSVIFLNFVLQDNFLWLGYMSYPFTRDPVQFTDYLSQTFPPFVDCTLDTYHKILLSRGETYGCQLTFMELYEKIFLILWAVLFILIIITAFHILGMLFICIPVLNKILFITPYRKIKLPSFSIGDVYYLYCIKKCIPPDQFYYIINELTNKKKKV